MWELFFIIIGGGGLDSPELGEMESKSGMDSMAKNHTVTDLQSSGVW